MKVGQIITISANNTEGPIVAIHDYYVDIDWQNEGGKSEHSNPFRYDLSHVENLIGTGTLLISDELPKGNPNLSFKTREQG